MFINVNAYLDFILFSKYFTITWMKVNIFVKDNFSN